MLKKDKCRLIFRFLDSSQEMVAKDGRRVRNMWEKTFSVAREDIGGSPASEGAFLSLIPHLLSGSAWFLCSVMLGCGQMFGTPVGRYSGLRPKMATCILLAHRSLAVGYLERKPD